MREEDIKVYIQFYFEIKNSKMFGGSGSIGYGGVGREMSLSELRDVNEEYVESYRTLLAEVDEVRAEDVRFISKAEYDRETEENDGKQ